MSEIHNINKQDK